MLSLPTIESDLNKKEKYELLLSQIKSLTNEEKNLIANLANVSAILKSSFQSFSWVGFYLFDGSELVLGPFQGPLACTRIQIGKGVCGKSFQLKETILVDDVNQFEGHIACSAETQSEIVVPISIDEKVVAVMDVDSNNLNNFDLEDKEGLEDIADVLSALF